MEYEVRGSGEPVLLISSVLADGFPVKFSVLSPRLTGHGFPGRQFVLVSEQIAVAVPLTSRFHETGCPADGQESRKIL